MADRQAESRMAENGQHGANQKQIALSFLRPITSLVGVPIPPAAPPLHHRPPPLSTPHIPSPLPTLWHLDVAQARALSRRDALALSVTYTYAFSLIGFAELIRRRRGYPQDFTRKVVHIGAGMWVFGVLALFENWYIGIIPFSTFILLNYLAYRFRLFESVDTDDSSPGTIYFALSVALLFGIFWRTNTPRDRSAIAAAGVMAMTWGDALASIIGRRWGRHRYTIWGDTRSFEGSATLLLTSATAIFLTLRLVPGSTLSPQSHPLHLQSCITGALAGSLTATLAEAVSPSGSDNLSVPILAALAVLGATTASEAPHAGFFLVS